MNLTSLPSITIGKYRWWGTNHHELVGIKHEVFQQLIYDTDVSSTTPVILDAGAHVGLAALYFKRRYPQSRIICIEPHSLLVEILQHNLWFNHLDGVEVVAAALSDHVGTQTLYADDSQDLWLSTTGPHGAWDHRQTTAPLTVNTLTLDSLITQPIDLLKMDIEGFELPVLQASHKLSLIKQVILELHPPTTPQQIQKIFNRTHTVNVEPHHFGLKLVRALGLEPRTKRV